MSAGSSWDLLILSAGEAPEKNIFVSKGETNPYYSMQIIHFLNGSVILEGRQCDNVLSFLNFFIVLTPRT